MSDADKVAALSEENARLRADNQTLLQAALIYRDALGNDLVSLTEAMMLTELDDAIVRAGGKPYAAPEPEPEPEITDYREEILEERAPFPGMEPRRTGRIQGTINGHTFYAAVPVAMIGDLPRCHAHLRDYAAERLT